MGKISRLNQCLLIVLSILLFLYPKVGLSQVDSTGSQSIIVHKITITGNKTTRLHIIMRELIFHTDDTLPQVILQNAIKRSQENLMNTGLFNFVEINQLPGKLNSTDIEIKLTERWYIWPFPFFEVVDRNFNEWWLTRDLKRTDYGVYLVHENFRGRNESLKIQLRLGYSQRIGLYYNIPYINKKQNLGMSFGGYYTRNHEISYATENNKLLYYKDPKNYVRKDWNCFSRMTYRTGIYDYYSMAVEYRFIDVADTIIDINQGYLVNRTNKQQQLSYNFNYRHDERDYQPYPLKGHLLQIDISKIGTGLLKNEPDLLVLGFSTRFFKEWLPRWHSSISVTGKVSGMKDTPYINLRALGYGSDVVRGYEYYVINGNNFILFKANIAKYTLFKTHIYNIRFINSEKFRRVPNTVYISLSSDVGYVSDHQYAKTNQLSNKWLSGYGAGLDYVTYYDLVFRFEYSINNLGERGFFLNFAAPF